MAVEYAYTARNREGVLSKGTLDAENEAGLRTVLRARGLQVETVKEQTQKKGLFGGKRVKMKDLAVFSRQFAVMISSGLTLMRALTILSEQSENATLAATLKQVKADVESGSDLSSSIAKFPKVFPELMVNMTRAGETGGFLDSTMVQIAENYEAEVRLRGKIKSAMTYPVVVFVLAILMCIAMLIFVVPTFKSMFASLGGTLPLPTQVLVWMSASLKFALPFLVVAGIAFVWWWRKYSTHPKVRNIMDPLKLRIPVFGVLFQKIALTRFARNFSTLLDSGVPILACLDIVSNTTGSVVIARALKAVQESVKQGETVAKPLETHEVFPPMVVQMIAVGEDTGQLDQMLAKIAEFYDGEVEAMTESLTALIEPLMIAFLGAVVGSMIVALYMPIFKVFTLIG